MTRNADKLRVNVVIEVNPITLQSVVANCKRIARRDSAGVCHVDTADTLGEMISRFLDEYNFQSFVQDPRNYKT